MKSQEGTMRFKLRYFLQCLCLICAFFAIISLSFYEISKRSGNNANEQVINSEKTPVWLERAPRSVGIDYDTFVNDEASQYSGNYVVNNDGKRQFLGNSVLKSDGDREFLGNALQKSDGNLQISGNSLQKNTENIQFLKDYETEQLSQKTLPISPNSLYENSKKILELDTLKKYNPKILLDRTREEISKHPLSLDDIYISVKTTKDFHQSRLDIIIKTWFTLAKQQTWFFTDTDDVEMQAKTGGHLVNTGCSSSHNRRALCCKMAKEFDAFIEANTKWWCHFDDDNYVNIPTLVKTLESFDSQQEWYLGRPSIRSPLEIMNRDDMSQKISFWFATGGAGFCISRAMGMKMMPIAGGGKFVSVGEKIRLPDDVTMGYIIEHLLKKKLTIVNEFHSHLEPMRLIDTGTLTNQISFGYSHYGSEMNALPIQGLPQRRDPTRFYSLHCLLFPSSNSCKET